MPFLRHRQTDNAYSFDEATGKRTSTALTFQLLYAFTSVGNEGFRIQGHSSGRSCGTPAAKYSIHWQLTHSRECKRWSKYCTRHRTTPCAHASTRLLVSRDNVFHTTVRWVPQLCNPRIFIINGGSPNGCDGKWMWPEYSLTPIHG